MVDFDSIKHAVSQGSIFHHRQVTYAKQVAKTCPFSRVSLSKNIQASSDGENHNCPLELAIIFIFSIYIYTNYYLANSNGHARE